MTTGNCISISAKKVNRTNFLAGLGIETGIK
jgi:hypothetical protein